MSNPTDVLDLPKRKLIAELGGRETAAHWLAAVAVGEITETYVTKEGEAIDVPCKMRDRLKAMDILAKLQGWYAPIQHNHTGSQVVLHTFDNGRLNPKNEG
jgi:hypothetical protein